MKNLQVYITGLIAAKIVQLWQHFCQSVNLLLQRVCPFHVVRCQHSTQYHFTGMRCVYAFYENKRKHSHKFWQGEILSWLVSLGEEKERKKDSQASDLAPEQG